MTKENIRILHRPPPPGRILPGHILFDIDGTLTGDRAEPQIAPQHVMGNALFDILMDEFAHAGGDPHQAEALFLEYAKENVFWDYPDYIQRFRLPPQRTWARLREWHLRHLKVFPDGVELVRRLHHQGRHLHIISNNPLTGCLLKLEAAGLGALDGTSWFQRVFCSNITHGQKGRVEYWERALISAGLQPADVMVVGNDPKEDGFIPFAAGVRSFVLVDRGGQFTPEMLPAGAVTVSSLHETLALFDA